MEATRTSVDKTTRQDLILGSSPSGSSAPSRASSRRSPTKGVEVAQATVSRDLAELGVLKVGNRYLALPHEPGSAGIEVLPSFILDA